MNESKYTPKMGDESKKQILELHNQGLSVFEILKMLKLTVTDTAIRSFIKKQGLTPNKPKIKDKTKPCEICGKIFEYRAKTRDKTCSEDCRRKAIGTKNTKYDQRDIDIVLKLRENGMTIKRVSEISDVDVNKVKKVLKLHGTQK